MFSYFHAVSREPNGDVCWIIVDSQLFCLIVEFVVELSTELVMIGHISAIPVGDFF